MDKDMFSFVIYMIYACANHWKQTPSKVYKNMKDTNCIMGFLVPNYEILHTQSTKYIIEDIKEYFSVRGDIYMIIYHGSNKRYPWERSEHYGIENS